MFIVIHNKSKGRVFRKTKRIITSVLPLVDKRLNIGDLPLRVLNQLIENLKKCASQGLNIKIFIYKKQYAFKFELIELGKKEKYLKIFNE